MPQAAGSIDRSQEFLSFVKQQARAMRAGDAPPASLETWKEQREVLRQKLIQSWGGFPKDHCPLEPKVVGEFQRDGYRVQKLLLQTRPGILMTANAYVPDGGGRRPAVLSVHGHWREAKSAPVVQSRCIGLAKLGFFVLMVDAFGAGERALGKALGEYHGEMVAATLWPTGLALAGLQVYDNMRAIDYIQSRPEVNPDQIGVTGASGGGNQTMYVGAVDERLKCVVPVCSVGTYDSYLGAACCMCEVTPDALTYTEEAGVLSLVAPRGLMIVSATRDAFQFSVGEAKKSLADIEKVYRLYGKERNVRHAIFESKHDYNREMREAMYGWMTLHLKGEGDGAPIDEPKFEPEQPETVRCFPGDSRPDDFVTLPQFAAAEGRRLLMKKPVPNHEEQWESNRTLMLQALPRVLGGMPQPTELNLKVEAVEEDEANRLTFTSEAGITITADKKPAKGNRRGRALLLNLDEGRKAVDGELAAALIGDGWDLVTLDLRATGALAWPRDQIYNAPDHNTAEWGMLIGRPLLGQWVWDVKRLLDALDEQEGNRAGSTAVIGVGPAGLVALCAAALDGRIKRVATVGTLASYVSDVPYQQQRLGIMVPGLLRDVGDVGQLASLVAPRRLVIAGGVTGGGAALSADALAASFASTRAAYRFEKAVGQMRYSEVGEADVVVQGLA